MSDAMRWTPYTVPAEPPAGQREVRDLLRMMWRTRRGVFAEVALAEESPRAGVWHVRGRRVILDGYGLTLVPVTAETHLTEVGT